MLSLPARRILTGILSLSLCALSHPPQVQAAISSQQGANITSRYTDDFASSGFQQSLRNLRATGANSVSLIIPYYQSSNYSTDIQAGWNTPSDAALVSGIHAAEGMGLNVMLTLHDDPYSGDWRANIDPGDRNGWFVNYGQLVNHYAQLSQDSGVRSFCIGAELFHMTSTQIHRDNTSHWQSIIADARTRFSGLITYSANWGAPYNEKDQIGFWGALDEIGLAAYFGLATQTNNPSVNQLTASWNDWNRNEIAPLAATYGKPVVFTEIGYESANDSHYAPGVYGRSGLNLAEQANDYQAVLSYWSTQPNFNGIYFWDWSSDPNAGGTNDNSYTPQHKPAEQLMSQYFTGSTPAPVIPPVPSNPLVGQPIQIWWPVNNAQVNGVQPFKVTIGGRDPGSYQMYWQVDGGQLNSMGSTNQDLPHKESAVDLSNWGWQPNGTYQITFVAKDSSGAIMATAQSSIHISR